MIQSLAVDVPVSQLSDNQDIAEGEVVNILPEFLIANADAPVCFRAMALDTGVLSQTLDG